MKPIPGYEGLYSATKDGHIFSHGRSIIRTAKHCEPYRVTYGEKILREGQGKKTARQKQPRYYVNLYKDSKPRKWLVHRLICLAYHENPENKPEVNHIDGNHLNNRPENLEWCTRSENVQHAVKMGTWSNGK